MNCLQRTLPLFLAPCLWLAGNAAAQSNYSLHSPDKKTEVRIRAGSHIQYDVLRNGKILLQDCAMSIRIDQATLGRDVKVKAAKEQSADRRAARANTGTSAP